jgi:hypothetical protein
MSYAPPLKVRYGTAVEPWHTLGPWYRGFGQVDTATMPLVGIAVGLFALALIGGAAAERHQRSLYANRKRGRKQRRKRNRRAGRLPYYGASRIDTYEGPWITGR